jgi:hypothetical protein
MLKLLLEVNTTEAGALLSAIIAEPVRVLVPVGAFFLA